jgi:hypothetical protein
MPAAANVRSLESFVHLATTGFETARRIEPGVLLTAAATREITSTF